MKKVYILHYWGEGVGPNNAWYPWLKKELEAKGYEVFVPQMPNTDRPIIEERVNFLKGLVGVSDKDTYFVGHSIGCQTVIRYFETLPEKTKIGLPAQVGGAIFVAGWFKLGNLEGGEVENIARPWMETPINFEKVKSICPNITVFLSDNEPYDCIDENKKIFEEKLGAKVTVLQNKGHFTEDDNITELPEVSELF